VRATGIDATTKQLMIKKTEFIILCKSSQIEITVNVPIIVGNSIILSTECIKYLGVLIDNTLTFRNEIQAVAKMISPFVYFFYKASQFISLPYLKLLYNAFVVSRLTYSASLLNSCYDTHITILQSIQTKIVKGLLRFRKSDSASLAFRLINVLTVKQLCKYRVQLLAFKLVNNNFHNVGIILAYPNSQTRNTNLNKLFVPRFNTTIGCKSFDYTVAITWNELPSDICASDSFAIFKNRCKNLSL
jgi:hypothetical protein